MKRKARPMKFLLLTLLLGAPLRAQEANIHFPVAEIEMRLRTQPFTIFDMRGSRFEEDRTHRVRLTFPDSQTHTRQMGKSPQARRLHVQQ